MHVERTRSGQMIVGGYAAVFYREGDSGTEYRLLKTLTERIGPNAFKRALSSGGNIRALWNHESSRLLGSTETGTLKLHTDARGLHFNILLPDDADGHKVYSAVERGDLNGASFGFFPIKTTYSRGANGKPDVALVEDLYLTEVSPVTFPAYRSTSAYITTQRSLDPNCVRAVFMRMPTDVQQRLLTIERHEEIAERLAILAKN